MVRTLRRCVDVACRATLPATARTSTWYCSAACRQRDYRRRLRSQEIEWRSEDERRCDRCGKERPVIYRPAPGRVRLKRLDAKFCSDRCRKLSHDALSRLRTQLGQDHAATFPRRR